MGKWQKVFSAPEAYKAEIVKDILESNGLNPVIVNKKDSAYTNLGQFEVHVAADEVIKSLNIIENDVNFG